MKRISCAVISVILSLIMVFCLGGCKENSAYNLVSNATKKTAELDSYAAKMTMNMSLQFKEEKIDIPSMCYEIKAAEVRSQNPRMRISTTSSAEGLSSDVDMYIENGNCYITTMGESYQVPLEKLDEDMKLDKIFDKLIVEFPKELFDGVEITEKENGVKEVLIPTSEETFAELYSHLLEKTTDTIGASDADIEVSNISVKIEVDKKGHIASETVCFTTAVSMTAASISLAVTADTEVKLEYIDPGSKVTVEAIEGYQDFTVLEVGEEYEF